MKHARHTFTRIAEEGFYRTAGVFPFAVSSVGLWIWVSGWKAVFGFGAGK